MNLENPQEWAEGAKAFKAAVDGLRSVWQLVKEFRAGGKEPTVQEQEVIERAMVEADKAAKVAEAHIAKALGYPLCHCQFPPVAMLTVGQLQLRQAGGRFSIRPVHECPTCHYCDAGDFSFHRTASRKEATGD